MNWNRKPVLAVMLVIAAVLFSACAAASGNSGVHTSSLKTSSMPNDTSANSSLIPNYQSSLMELVEPQIIEWNHRLFFGDPQRDGQSKYEPGDRIGTLAFVPECYVYETLENTQHHTQPDILDIVVVEGYLAWPNYCYAFHYCFDETVSILGRSYHITDQSKEIESYMYGSAFYHLQPSAGNGSLSSSSAESPDDYMIKWFRVMKEQYGRQVYDHYKLLDKQIQKLPGGAQVYSIKDVDPVDAVFLHAVAADRWFVLLKLNGYDGKSYIDAIDKYVG